MNERIKELVGQAKFIAEETINKQISKNAELDAFAEKFAELIVRECMSITNKCSTGPGIHDLFADEIIAQHFGVEE